jgi:NADH-quinone oxidoreductase subunit D
LQPATPAVSGVLEHAGVSSSFEEETTLGAVCRVEAGSVRATLNALRDSELDMAFLLDLFGIDTGEQVDVVYHVRSFSRDQDLVIKAAHAYDSVLESVWDIFPAALMPEREVCELFGMRLSGHPNPKRLLTTDGCPPFLRKEIPVRTADEVQAREEQVLDISRLARTVGSLEPEPPASTPGPVPPTEEGMTAPGVFQPVTRPAGLTRAPAGVDHISTEHLVLSMGSQHPSTHGVLRISLELDGEEVVTGETIIGHLHRGIEKLAESRRYGAVGTLMDRGDYVSGIHGELAFALATERLLEVEVPARAHWLRSLLGEMNRIASHMTWYGPSGLDAGMMGLFLYVFRDRETLLDIIEEITGQRMMFNYVRPGGVLRDITPTADARIRSFLDQFDTHMDENEQLLMDNEIYQARARGIGVLDRDKALAFGLTGGNLRASGFDFDLRRDHPYAAYPELEFDVPTAQEGDVYARVHVRVQEMRQSARMIRQCIDGLPEGDFTAKVPKALRTPAGESYAAVESPRGELGVHLVSDGSTSPYRMRYRPPAMYALQAGETLLPGSLIADVVLVMGSMDIVLGEIDR